MKFSGRSRSRSLSILIHSIMALAATSNAVAGTLSGRISDATGVKSLQSVEVELVELGRRTQTTADGQFRFSAVPDGRYTLRARYVGASAVERTVDVSGETNAVITLGSDQNLIDNVLVVGQRASLSSSLSRQRAADGVESVLTRDGIGQFPDQNAAESLRRVAGVNVLNDQGEGRFVAVRGLSPDLNAVSINGARVPAPEADVRSVALDVIPSELVESIEIRKSLTPDMDADTVGASIEINTTSALDRRESFLSFTADSSYNDLNEEWSPRSGIDFSTRLSERFGIAGGVSYYEREFATDNVEMDGWGVNDDDIAYADTVEYRDYDVERTRLGGSLSLDFRASDSTTLYARYLRSRFEDQEYRGRLIFEMDEPARSGTPDRADFSSSDGAIAVIRDLKDRYEEQTITSFTAGGDTYTGPWTLHYNAAWSEAREREGGSLDPVAFEREFENAGEFDVSFNYESMTLPRYRITRDSENAFNDPAACEFDQVDRTTLSLSEDQELALRFDVAREFTLESNQLTVQAGAKARQREKTYDLDLDVYDGFDGDYTLADVTGRQSYGLLPLGPLPSAGVRSFFNQNRASFELDDTDTAFESGAADYAVDEDIYAAYVLGRYEAGPLRIVGGVRAEQTRNDIAANVVELVAEGGERDGVVLDEDAVFVSRTEFDRDYTDVLPSINVRYQATNEVILRAGVYRSLVRPQIGQLAPRFLVEENDESEREGEFGNPELEPYEAWNADFSAEWYFGGNGVLQAGVFAKRIDNFIVMTEFEELTMHGVYADEAVMPINGEQADVLGVEFNYQQALTFLPSPLDGLLFGLNYTWTDAEGEVNGRTVSLPAAAEHTANVSLGYEKGPISVRATAAYRDLYLDELGGSYEEDRHVEDHLQYDLSMRYRVTPELQLVAEFVNLGDEPYVAYQPGPGRKRLLQYEEYSWTGKFGFRYTF